MDLALDPKTTALVLIDVEHAIVAMTLAPHTSAEWLAGRQSWPMLFGRRVAR